MPTFFAPEERPDFRLFLETLNAEVSPYLVLIREGSVIACRGLFIEAEKRQAYLAWGMVDRKLHRQGLGTILTQARLTLARANPIISELTLSTSQHTYGFYEGFGFTVSKTTPDGFGTGLDRLDMALSLT